MMVLALVACRGAEIPVGVTLGDGQVLVGEVTTPVLSLDGAFGAVDVPLDDVGMVVPVEAATLGASHDQVTVWLRNGSELRGRWLDPELRMSLAMGGGRVAVRLPPADVGALQLRGQEDWPRDDLFRIRTSHGDDLLVDPARTRIELTNDLGAFAPFLSECVRVGPVGDPEGPWRVELRSGTVLVGTPAADHLRLALPAGPPSVEVALADLVSLDRDVWSTPAPEEEAAPPLAASATTPAPRGGLSDRDGWFENTRLESAKRR